MIGLTPSSTADIFRIIQAANNIRLSLIHVSLSMECILGPRPAYTGTALPYQAKVDTLNTPIQGRKESKPVQQVDKNGRPVYGGIWRI